MKTTNSKTGKMHWLMTALMMTVTVIASAQNPSWLLSGNSDATTSSFVGTTNAVSLQFGTNNTVRMALLYDNPYLGVGTTSPVSNLHIHGSQAANPRPVPTTFQMTNPSTGSTTTDGFKIFQSSLAVTISQLEKANLNVFNNGNGSPCWPDYVFSKDYDLMSLKELGSYVNENSHLPDIPSAEEVQQNGVELGEMNTLLLQKIEELTLYILDLQKQIDELKTEGGRR